MKNARKTVNYISSIGFGIGCSVLFLIALYIIFYALTTAVIDVMNGGYKVNDLLDDVSLLVFAIAVMDVSKYLALEEVFPVSAEKRPEDLKTSLTRFISIVVTALFLKGLVLSIQVSVKDVSLLLYPVSLLLTPVLLIVGMGLYHKLEGSSRKKNR